MSGNSTQKDLRIGARALLIIYAIWCLFPVYWLVATSLKTEIDVVARPPIFVFAPTFKNYLDVLTDPAVLGFFKNSLIVGLGTTIFGLLIGVPAGSKRIETMRANTHLGELSNDEISTIDWKCYAIHKTGG